MAFEKANFLCVKRYAKNAEHITVRSDCIPSGWLGMDIGHDACEEFSKTILAARTVIWNGPMGVFEMPVFAAGTEAIAGACADCEGVTIIGGGDSASAVNMLGFANRITHISTGGGASLELLEGKILPGIAVLEEK